MTEPIQAAMRLGVPRILCEAASLDGNLDELIGWAKTADGPEPLVGAQPKQEEAAPQLDTSSPILPLYDRNGIFLHYVTRRQAQEMVNSGQADRDVMGGWRDRDDVEWLGVRLTMTPDLVWSHSSLSECDAKRIAGELGPDPDEYILAKLARAKLYFWPLIHDDRAPMVMCR